MKAEEIQAQHAALVALGIDDQTPRSEMARRIVNQASHIQAYARCLDGMPLSPFENSGIESARSADDIRRIADRLKGRLLDATQGEAKCSSCGKLVNNAWRDEDGHWCLTCLAAQRDEAREELITLTQNQK